MCQRYYVKKYRTEVTVTTERSIWTLLATPSAFYEHLFINVT